MQINKHNCNLKVKCKKTRTALSLLFILLSSFLFSQDFSIGIKDGITWSSIKGRYDFKNFENTQIEKVTGHSFGLIFNYRFSNHFSFQTEINLEEKGFDFKSDIWIDGGAYSGNYNINYLTIPVIINYELGKTVKYYGYAGIYWGLLTQVENQTTFSSTSQPYIVRHDYSYDPTDEFYKNELGLILGLGLKVPLCEQAKIIIDARYNWGLTKAAKNNDYNYNPTHWTFETPNNFQDVYNHSLTISLGILYKIKKKK